MTTQYSPAWNNASRTQTCIRANVSDSGSAANSTLLDLQVNNVSKFTVDKFGELIIAPTARTAGSDALINLVAPADTTRAAGVEATDINFNLARTVQFAAGNITDQRAVRIQAPTYSFASASTITNASTLSISGPPVAGTNATITNRWALNIDNARVGLWSPFDTNTDVLVIGPSAAEDFASLRLRTRAIVFNSSGNSGYIANGGQNADHGNLYFGYGTVGTNAVAGFTNRGWAFLGQNMPVWFGATSGAGPSGTGTAIYAPAANTLEQRNTTNAQTFRLYNTFTDASNYERLAFQFGTFSSARHAQIAAESAGTGVANINLVLTPKGTGAFILGPPPDGTATGGNARGANAVDMQTARQSASQVASGQYSAVFGFGSTASDRCGFAAGYLVSVTGPDAAGFGQNLTISGPAAFAINLGCEAVSNYSFASGLNARTYLETMRAHAGGSFANRGDSQYSRFVLRNKTTTDSAVALRMWDTINNPRRLVVPAGKILLCSAMVIGSKSDGSVVATYFRQFSVKRVGNTTSLVGTVNTIGTDNAAGTSLSITADDTSESIEIAPTGVLNETWRWAAVVEAIEIEFGT